MSLHHQSSRPRDPETKDEAWPVGRPPGLSRLMIGLAILALATLACAFLQTTAPYAARVAPTRTPQPTFTLSAMPADRPNVPPTSPPQPPGTAAPAVALPATQAAAVPALTPPPAEVSLPSQPAGATDTPTAGAPAAPTAILVNTPPPVPTATPVPIQPDASTPTQPPATEPAPGASGWSFTGVQIYRDQYAGGLLMYGTLVNETGAAQEITFITGTFYDAQGQIIADEGSAYGYSPVLVLPAGGRAPFELIVEGIQDPAKFDLRVDAQPSSQVARQDFELSDVYQLDDENGYCIGGTIQNPGAPVQDDLVILAVVFDNQERVISFGEDYPDYENLVGDQSQDFEICIDTYGQAVIHYELVAWGQ